MQRVIKVGGRLFRLGICYQADEYIQTIVRVCNKRWGHQWRSGIRSGVIRGWGSVMERGEDWMAGTTVSI